MTKQERAELLTAARDIAVGAGRIIKRGFSHSKRISYKGRIDPVTEFDVKAEQYVVGQIKRRFPHDQLLTEEETAGVGRRDRTDDQTRRWIIDPIDGTVNFAHGFPVYCVSIGVESDGRVQAGAVFDPEREELFSASLDGGAFLNRSRIEVSSEGRLDRALLATGFAYDIATNPRNNLGIFARMAKKAQGIRRPGSAALDLCWLAAGRIDGFWELYLHPWDTAAASLIVTEAGGRISRLDGRTYTIYDKELLASNGHLHRSMQRVLTSSD
jgi:myo-inositol-1(or 4)-monophosphatase